MTLGKEFIVRHEGRMVQEILENATIGISANDTAVSARLASAGAMLISLFAIFIVSIGLHALSAPAALAADRAARIVSLDSPERGGVLSHASVLTVTS